MKHKIFKSTFLMTIILVGLTLLLVIWSMYGYFSYTLENRTRDRLSMVAGGLEHFGKEYLDSFNSDSMRITWISADGTVIFDNELNPSDMGNHLERPEVQQAIAEGRGESSRYSSSLLEKQFYCAEKLSDGSIVRLASSQKTILTLLIGFIQPIIIIVLVTSVLSYTIASNLSKKIVNPINGIDLNNPLEANTYEELQPLLTRIAAQQKQLRRDQKELEKTEKIRKEFTANVSHELKTPLHTISGYAELIKEGIASQEDILPFAEKIYDESRRMSQLVEDVIDLNTLDSQIAGMDCEEADLSAIAQNVADSLRDFAAERNVEIQTECKDAVLTGYPKLLHSIVYNLCDNAVKYNKDGGSVNIRTGTENGSVVLRVKDTGIGIPEESLDRVFERFYRVDKSRSKTEGGTGLGLSIVKHAAAIHGGEVRIASTPGEGTEITVIFPVQNTALEFSAEV